MAGEPELADLEIDDAGAKGEEEPMADLEDPATATLVNDMAEEEPEEEGEAADEEAEADEGYLEDEEMDEMLAACRAGSGGFAKGGYPPGEEGTFKYKIKYKFRTFTNRTYWLVP